MDNTMINKQLDEAMANIEETIRNEKGLNDVLVYGNYSYNMGVYHAYLEMFFHTDMDCAVNRYEKDKPTLDKWLEWSDKLYRKLTGKDGDI